jgi:hypothetical protein
MLWSNWTQYRCSRKAVVRRDGRGYCKIHDPVVKAARRTAREAKWDAKDAVRKIEDEAQAMSQDVLTSVRDWLKGTLDIEDLRAVARDWAAKSAVAAEKRAKFDAENARK